MSHPPPPPLVADRPPRWSAYWRRTLKLSAGLLAVWLLATLGVGLFGRSISLQVLGWPLGFWATAQGALLLFCAIVWFYAWAMDRLDRAHGGHVDD